MKKNILIVDDHPIVSTGLQALIEHTGEYGKIYVTNNIASSRLLLRQKDIDIAQQLNISNNTVEFHRHNLMKKLSANNMAQLVKKAIQLGLNFIK